MVEVIQGYCFYCKQKQEIVDGQIKVKGTYQSYVGTCKVCKRKISARLKTRTIEQPKGGENMGFFKKKQPQELPPVAPPIKIEEVGSEEDEETFEQEDDEQPRMEMRGRPRKGIEREPEDIQELEEANKTTEEDVSEAEVLNAISNHEQRLQAIEAALFRVKGSI